MTEQSAHALLNDIVAFAQDVICKPMASKTERHARCEELEGQLEAAIAAGSSFSRHLDNGAPLLLHAIDRALLKREYGDDASACAWESIVGSLMPLVRSDAGAAMMASREVVTERPQR